MKRCLLLVPLALLSCIERPQGFHSDVDRSGLSDVLMTSAPMPAHYVGARFDSGIELVGYDVSPEPVGRGDIVTLVLYYTVSEEVHDDWEIFIHLDDVGRTAQRTIADHFPGNGRFHTNGWRKGDIIRDTYRVRTPPDATALEFWTGFFQGDDRLPVVSPGQSVNDGNNRIRLGVIAMH